MRSSSCSSSTMSSSARSSCTTPSPGVLPPIVFSLIVVSGIAITLRRRAVTVLVGVMLAQAFRAGPIDLHRIQGAVAVFLLLAHTWALAYTLVALGDPGAFSTPISGLTSPQLLGRLSYFSTVTLTTVGCGDLMPVSPVARSLAALEALTGQLFPAILLARLVSLELYHKASK